MAVHDTPRTRMEEPAELDLHQVALAASLTATDSAAERARKAEAELQRCQYELDQIRAEQRAAAEREAARQQEAERVEAAIRAATEQALEAERAELAASQPVVIRLRGAPDHARTACPPSEPPPGCSILRGALSRELIHRSLQPLRDRVHTEGRPITAGQTDGKRMQLKLAGGDEELCSIP